MGFPVGSGMGERGVRVFGLSSWKTSAVSWDRKAEAGGRVENFSGLVEWQQPEKWVLDGPDPRHLSTPEVRAVGALMSDPQHHRGFPKGGHWFYQEKVGRESGQTHPLLSWGPGCHWEDAQMSSILDSMRGRGMFKSSVGGISHTDPHGRLNPCFLFSFF